VENCACECPTCRYNQGFDAAELREHAHIKHLETTVESLEKQLRKLGTTPTVPQFQKVKLGDDDERPTSVECPLCKGSGLRPILTSGEKGNYHSTMRACWLCDGAKVISPALKVLWVSSGKPEKKEDMI